MNAKRLVWGGLEKVLGSLGFGLVRIPPPGRQNRPVGQTRLFLEDIKARGLRCRGIVDVGANRGEWARMAMSIFPQAQFLLVEPQEEMREPLRKLSEEHSNVEYVLAGAGSQEGELLQTIYGNPEGSTFLPTAEEAGRRSGRQRKTRIVTLDATLRERKLDPDLVKLDVQGFELEVLKGASALFGRTQVFILETSLYRFYEAMPLTREVIAFMASRGYEIYDITEFHRRPYDGALGQVDIAFALGSGSLRASSQWS